MVLHFYQIIQANLSYSLGKLNLLLGNAKKNVSENRKVGTHVLRKIMYMYYLNIKTVLLRVATLTDCLTKTTKT